MSLKELIFVVEEDPEGGYTARALGESIFTEADDQETLKENIRDAMECHFDRKEDIPRIVRLHMVRSVYSDLTQEVKRPKRATLMFL